MILFNHEVRDAAASLSPNVYPTSGSVIVRPAYVFVAMPAYEVSEVCKNMHHEYLGSVSPMKSYETSLIYNSVDLSEISWPCL